MSSVLKHCFYRDEFVRLEKSSYSEQNLSAVVMNGTTPGCDLNHQAEKKEVDEIDVVTAAIHLTVVQGGFRKTKVHQNI